MNEYNYRDTHVGFLFDLSVGQLLFGVLVVLFQRVFELLSFDEAAVVGVELLEDRLSHLLQLSLIGRHFLLLKPKPCKGRPVSTCSAD